MKARSNLGFTLTELMVSIFIGSIMLMLVVPSYYDLIQNNRVTSLTNQLVGQLGYARAEAVKRGVNVSFCPAETNTTCAVTSKWDNGWLIYVDSNGSGDLNNGEEIIKVQESVSNQVAISNNLVNLSFDRNGFYTGNLTAFNLSPNKCTGQNARIITISGAGRLSSKSANCP